MSKFKRFQTTGRNYDDPGTPFAQYVRRRHLAKTHSGDQPQYDEALPPPDVSYSPTSGKVARKLDFTTPPSTPPSQQRQDTGWFKRMVSHFENPAQSPTNLAISRTTPQRTSSHWLSDIVNTFTPESSPVSSMSSSSVSSSSTGVTRPHVPPPYISHKEQTHSYWSPSPPTTPMGSRSEFETIIPMESNTPPGVGTPAQSNTPPGTGEFAFQTPMELSPIGGLRERFESSARPPEMSDLNPKKDPYANAKLAAGGVVTGAVVTAIAAAVAKHLLNKKSKKSKEAAEVVDDITENADEEMKEEAQNENKAEPPAAAEETETPTETTPETVSQTPTESINQPITPISTPTETPAAVSAQPIQETKMENTAETSEKKLTDAQLMAKGVVEGSLQPIDIIPTEVQKIGIALNANLPTETPESAANSGKGQNFDGWHSPTSYPNGTLGSDLVYLKDLIKPAKQNRMASSYWSSKFGTKGILSGTNRSYWKYNPNKNRWKRVHDYSRRQRTYKKGPYSAPTKFLKNLLKAK